MKTTILRKRNSIIIQYRINGKQFRIYTGIHCHESEWNKKNKSILGNTESSISANQLIKRYRDEVESYINDLKRNGSEYEHELLKKHLIQKLTSTTSPEVKKDLFYAFDIFLKNTELTPWFPSVLIGNDFAAAVDILQQVKPKLIVTNNTGIAYEAYAMGIPWVAGPTLNLVNSFSLLCLKENFNCSFRL